MSGECAEGVGQNVEGKEKCGGKFGKQIFERNHRGELGIGKGG